MRLSSVLPVFLLPLAWASSQDQVPVSVHLFPAPQSSSNHKAPTLTAAEAKAVIAHHLGTSTEFEEIPDGNGEGAWAQLVSLMEGKKSSSKSRVVIVEGDVLPQDILPLSVSQPTFYLPATSETKTLLSPYIHRAQSFLKDAVDAIPPLPKMFQDAFDLTATKASAALSNELSALISFAESLPWLNDFLHSSHTWEAIKISALADCAKDSDAYETGASGVRAGLEAMTVEGQPPLLLVLMPSADSFRASKRQARSLASPIPQTLAKNNGSSCYSSNSTCSDSTACSGRGSCALMVTKNNGDECWACSCDSGFAGVDCQKTDYTFQFVILVFSVVMLVGIVVGSITLLMSVGDTPLPSTLSLSMGGGSKRD